jgi:hypothetical protein
MLFNSTEGYSSEQHGKPLDISKTITRTLRRLSVGGKQEDPTSESSACRAHYGVGKKGLKNKRRKGDGDEPPEIDESNDDDFDQSAQNGSARHDRTGDQQSPDGHNIATTTDQGVVSRETAKKRDR